MSDAGSDMRLDVLYLTHNYPRHPGDFAGRFVARLAQLVSERSLSVGVLAPHHPGTAIHEINDGIPIWRFRYGVDGREKVAYRGEWNPWSLFSPGELSAYRRFFRCFSQAARDLVGQHRPSVVHAHWWIPAGWVAKALPGDLRLIVTLHGTDLRLLQRHRWLRPFAARVFARADLITTVSTWLAEFLKETFPKEANKVRVSPMPPDDDVFTGGVQHPVSDSAPVIVSVTRFTRQKRNEILLDALARLRARRRAFRSRIIGDGGSLREQFISRLRSLNLGEHVDLVGALPQAELAEEYRRAAVVVSSAVDEGFGMALVEAQLCGAAVVGARSGGFLDIIQDGVTGLFAGPGDALDLAEKIDAMIADEPLRLRLAEAGQRAAQARFSSTAIADRFVGWYKDVS